MSAKGIPEEKITSKCQAFKKNESKCKVYNKRYLVDEGRLLLPFKFPGKSKL